MQAWDFLVRTTDLSQTHVQPAAVSRPAALSEGEVLLAIERFSFTANNITYGVVGDRLGYWTFYPAPDGWGRIPVWGFARVVASRADGVDEGLRLYGYWPMSTHVTACLQPAVGGFVDAAPHRRDLAAAYNHYTAAPETPRDDLIALLRPLFTTSFLLADYLRQAAPDATAILSSASSRTAICLAWLLARSGRKAIGLTSGKNVEFVEGLGFYDTVVGYDGIDTLDPAMPTSAFIDLAGDDGLKAVVHRHFGDRLALSAIVGSTHHDARPGDGAPLPGPAPAFFFAPTYFAARAKDLGAAVLGRRIADAMDAFIEDNGWLQVERHHGPDALTQVYHAVRNGEARPDRGHIVLPGQATASDPVDEQPLG